MISVIISLFCFFDGCMVALWLYGLCLFYGFVWFYGFIVLWFYGFMVLWLYGFMGFYDFIVL